MRRSRVPNEVQLRVHDSNADMRYLVLHDDELRFADPHAQFSRRRFAIAKQARLIGIIDPGTCDKLGAQMLAGRFDALDLATHFARRHQIAANQEVLQRIDDNLAFDVSRLILDNKRLVMIVVVIVVMSVHGLLLRSDIHSDRLTPVGPSDWHAPKGFLRIRPQAAADDSSTAASQ
jgi:hypothetical protein